MPDEPISGLPPAVALLAADLAVAVASGVTSKITAQQLINSLVGLITAPVVLTGSNSVNGNSITATDVMGFNNDFRLHSTMYATVCLFGVAPGEAYVQYGGDATALTVTQDGGGLGEIDFLNANVNGGIFLNSDSSATFANGNISLNSDGSASFAGSMQFVINADGSFFCSGGNFSVDASGNTTIDGTLTPAGGIVGTTAGGNATTGNVGEFMGSLVASGSAVALVNGTGKTVTSIALTAGDWDVEGNVNFSASAATSTGASGGINTTTNTVPTDGSEVYSGLQTTILSDTNSVTLPRKRINVIGNQTVYLVAKCSFSAGTVSAFGSINARRVR